MTQSAKPSVRAVARRDAPAPQINRRSKMGCRRQSDRGLNAEYGADLSPRTCAVDERQNSRSDTAFESGMDRR